MSQIEIVLRGPLGVVGGDGEHVARNILVTVGEQMFRIPIPAQGCKELAQALTLSDEELAQATQAQSRAQHLVLPNGAG